MTKRVTPKHNDKPTPKQVKGRAKSADKRADKDTSSRNSNDRRDPAQSQYGHPFSGR